MLDTALPHFISDRGGEEETEYKQKQREKCRGCSRPLSVCLCSLLPSEGLLETSTDILILQHPHELRHKLATVPLVQKCLRNCEVIVGRRLLRGSSPFLDSIGHSKSKCQVLFLFPGEEAVDLDTWASKSSTPSSENETTTKEKEEQQGVLLIVIDGTWQHANEMIKASMPFLGEVGAVQVCLPYNKNTQGNNIWSSEEQLTLRKEPFGGCLSTIEAIARSLRILEPTFNGVHVEEKLLSVLHAMVAFQYNNLKPMRPRPKLLKKKYHCQLLKSMDQLGLEHKTSHQCSKHSIVKSDFQSVD